jgi:hypothetical protein
LLLLRLCRGGRRATRRKRTRRRERRRVGAKERGLVEVKGEEEIASSRARETSADGKFFYFSVYDEDDAKFASS